MAFSKKRRERGKKGGRPRTWLFSSTVRPRCRHCWPPSRIHHRIRHWNRQIRGYQARSGCQSPGCGFQLVVESLRGLEAKVGLQWSVSVGEGQLRCLPPQEGAQTY